MSDRIPTGWRKTTFGEILLQRTQKASGNEELLSVTASRGVIRQDEVGRRDSSSDDKTNYRKVEPGDIAYNTMRMWQGVSGVSRFSGIASPAYTICTPISDADSRFLGYLLKHPSYVQKFYRASQGLVSDTWNLKYSSFKDISVTIPPLFEQQQIGDILNTLDSQIASTEAVMRKTALIDRSLTADLLGRTDGQIKTISEVCISINVGIVVKPTQYYTETGIPVLRSLNIREGSIRLSDIKFMSEQDHAALRSSSLGPGDVVTVRTGAPGTTAVIPQSLPQANCVDIIVSRPIPDLMRAEYLSIWINSDYGRGQVLRGQGGLAQQHFNVSELSRMAIRVPTLKDQDSIIEVAKESRNRIKNYESELDKISQLKLGLMDDLLTGRVRVPHFK